MRKLILLTVVSAVALSSCAYLPESPLIRAAEKDDVAATTTLIAAGASQWEKQSALVAAARSDADRVIPVLIKSGADPNGISGVNGWTVLMHAIHKDARRALQSLLQNGADPNKRSASGLTPLALANDSGKSEAIRALLQR